MTTIVHYTAVTIHLWKTAYQMLSFIDHLQVLPWQNTTSADRAFLWVHFNMRSMGTGEWKACNVDRETSLTLVWSYLSLLHFIQGQSRGVSDLENGVTSRGYYYSFMSNDTPLQARWEMFAISCDIDAPISLLWWTQGLQEQVWLSLWEQSSTSLQDSIRQTFCGSSPWPQVIFKYMSPYLLTV